MEHLIRRRRVRISEVGQDSEEGSDNSRSEEIIPSPRTESFRDNKVENGRQRQFSSEMSHTDYDSSYEGEFASAIAAAAFAIYSAEESNSESYQNKKLRDATEIIPVSRVRTTMQDQFKPPESSQISNSTRFSGWEARDAAFMRIRMDQSEMGVSTSRGSSQAKADAWEKAAMAKIEKRYVKMNSAILAWENEKKMKAKQQMERKKAIQKQHLVMDCIHRLWQTVTDLLNVTKHLENELERSKSSLEIANADNTRLLGQFGSAKQENNALHAELQELKKARQKDMDEANNLGFKEAEDSYSKQVEATKDIFFKSDWKAACEKLGQGSETEVFTFPPPAFLPIYMVPYANNIFNSLQEDTKEEAGQGAKEGGGQIETG